MTDVATFLFSIAIGGMVITVILAMRNTAVFSYRTKLLSAISAAAKEDIELWRGYMWRYKIFESVSYDRMVLQFWKPLGSFYKQDPTAEPEVFFCLVCGKSSFHPEDIKNSYCGCCGNQYLPKNCEHWRVPVG